MGLFGSREGGLFLVREVSIQVAMGFERFWFKENWGETKTTFGVDRRREALYRDRVMTRPFMEEERRSINKIKIIKICEVGLCGCSVEMAWSEGRRHIIYR